MCRNCVTASHTGRATAVAEGLTPYRWSSLLAYQWMARWTSRWLAPVVGHVKDEGLQRARQDEEKAKRTAQRSLTNQSWSRETQFILNDSSRPTVQVTRRLLGKLIPFSLLASSSSPPPPPPPQYES